MKNLKFILPMLAIIFAIGLTFAATNFKADPKNDNYATMYVNIDDTWHEIEVDCETGTANCTVEFSEDPSLTPYQVYNSRSLSDAASGSAGVKQIQGPVPSN